jgi:hypothetical protein
MFSLYVHEILLTILDQIVYLSIVGPLMLAAVLEWLLWLCAFIYCLVKVYSKADHWSIQVLAVVMIILFSVMRYVSRRGRIDISRHTIGEE